MPLKQAFEKLRQLDIVPVIIISGIVLSYSPAKAADDLEMSSLTQFCSKLQSKPQLRPDDETITDIADFAENNLGWRLIKQNVSQRGPAQRLHLNFNVPAVKKSSNRAEISGIDTTIISINGKLRGMRGTIIKQTDQTQNQLPASLFSFTPACQVIESRHILYDRHGSISDIMIKKPGAAPRIEPVNPPLLPLKPGLEQNHSRSNLPIIIGHIDSGIDYRRPAFAAHLLYDENGRLIGRDDWDGDHRPFDADLSLSPFFVRRHGSYIFDILHQTGIDFKLLPVRYPRLNMQMMGDIIHWLADQGAAIVMMPLGSRNADDWASFIQAAAAHPQMLFIISAGNNGVNIDKSPIYPAVNNLGNALTVTSTLMDGKLAQESNYGIMVDVGLPAENLSTIGIDGISVQKSGSSFAVPKLAAYITCLIQTDPQLAGNGNALAKTVLSRLQKGSENTAYTGFLPDQQLDQTCAKLQLPPNKG